MMTILIVTVIEISVVMSVLAVAVVIDDFLIIVVILGVICLLSLLFLYVPAAVITTIPNEIDIITKFVIDWNWFLEMALLMTTLWPEGTGS